MEEVGEWADAAEKDLSRAKSCFAGNDFEDCAFHSQQAAKKALKALYILKFKRLLKTHDLVILGKDVGLPENFVETCKELTAAYVYTRYPGVPEDIDITEASGKFVKDAEAIIEWTKKQLKK